VKYRKKPVVIEATQWFPWFQVEGVEPPAPNERGIGYGYIQTLEGRMMVSPGDWIITGVKGEKYPCKDDIFQATYELVEEAIHGGTD
jgi:hypothetical protein